MSIIRNRLYQFKQELLSNKDRAWYSHTNLLTAVDLLMEFSPANQCSVSGIEKGIFTCYEIKSCKEDVYSGNGLNFFGEKNYIVTTMACYKDILPDFRSGKFANYMSEKHPDSSTYYGIMVAIPFWGEATEEFNDPTPLSEDINWKLEIVLPCRQGIRTKSMTELLFCMLRSGR